MLKLMLIFRAVVAVKTVGPTPRAAAQHHAGITTSVSATAAINSATKGSIARFVAERTDSSQMWPCFSVRDVKNGCMQTVIRLIKNCIRR